MIDKEIVLHIIDGPGSGLTFIVLGFFTMIVVLVMVRATHSDSTAFARGKEAQRYENSEALKTSMAKLVWDQQQILMKLDKEKSDA